MNELQVISAAPTMSSREIAEKVGKKLVLVMRDIRSMLTDMFGAEAHSQFSEPDPYGRKSYNGLYRLPAYLADALLHRYSGIRVAGSRTKELAALAAIEQVLGVKLLRQYKVGPYRIDGFDKANNIAYEIDESGHRHRRVSDKEREMWIASQLGCRFVRVEV